MFTSSTILNRGAQIFLFSLSFISLSIAGALADGMPPEVKTSTTVTTVTDQEDDYSSAFVPLPRWTGRVHMPAMPDQLKPFGKPPSPPPTTPPAAPVTTPTPVATTTTTTTKTTTADETHKDEPPLTAISPFLDWIKSNPDAAAALARKEAAKYTDNSSSSNPPPPDSGTFDPNRPYWLPPIKNSTDNNSAPDTSSSSATYQRPTQ